MKLPFLDRVMALFSRLRKTPPCAQTNNPVVSEIDIDISEEMLLEMLYQAHLGHSSGVTVKYRDPAGQEHQKDIPITEEMITRGLDEIGKAKAAHPNAFETRARFTGAKPREIHWRNEGRKK